MNSKNRSSDLIRCVKNLQVGYKQFNYNITNKLVPYAAERSPDKWKKYTIGTGIKIISEKKARILNPDFFLITPWAFVKEFKKREGKWRKKGGKFIVPFP